MDRFAADEDREGCRNHSWFIASFLGFMHTIKKSELPAFQRLGKTCNMVQGN